MRLKTTAAVFVTVLSTFLTVVDADLYHPFVITPIEYRPNGNNQENKVWRTFYLQKLLKDLNEPKTAAMNADGAGKVRSKHRNRNQSSINQIDMKKASEMLEKFMQLLRREKSSPKQPYEMT